MSPVCKIRSGILEREEAILILCCPSRELHCRGIVSLTINNEWNLKEPHKESGEIACPTCNRTTAIPIDQDVSEFLKPNYNLKDIIDKWHKGNNCRIIFALERDSLDGSTKKCEYDCANKLDATKECVGCKNIAYCDECWTSVHKGTWKSHATAPVGEQIRATMCRSHVKEEIKIHCKTCDTDICSLCSITATHKGHDLDPLDDFANTCRSGIANSSTELLLRANKLIALKAEVELSITQVKQVVSCSVSNSIDDFRFT
jgi:uncharacterized protein YbaR (Trm112 family)